MDKDSHEIKKLRTEIEVLKRTMRNLDREIEAVGTSRKDARVKLNKERASVWRMVSSLEERLIEANARRGDTHDPRSVKRKGA